MKATYKIYMDGWKYDEAYSLQEAVEKVNRTINTIKTTNEIIIYNVETKEQRKYHRIVK